MLKALLRHLAFHAPWGAREVMLEACLDRVRIAELYARVLPRCKIVELGAMGDRGVVSSAGNDTMVIVEYAKTGTFAKNITEALTGFFESGGGSYLDVGANIGLMTIPIARNPLVRCLAFEPEPVNFDLLKRNVERNAPGATVEFHQVALFHARGSLSLALAEGNIGDHRLTLTREDGRRVIEVPAVPLDDFADRIPGPLAVKIDKQGAEPFVIAGGQKVLAKASLLAIEFCPYLMRRLGGEPSLVIDMVTKFDWIAVMDGGKSETPTYLKPSAAAAILRNKLQTAQDSDEDYVDILAIRGQNALTARCGT